MRDLPVSRSAVEVFSVPGATAARASDVLCVFALEIKKKILPPRSAMEGLLYINCDRCTRRIELCNARPVCKRRN